MKAKIKKTGEIVDVICYNTCSTIRSHQDYVSYIDSNGIEHDRESLNYYWDFEPMENTTNEHWQDVREKAIIAALQGAVSRSHCIEHCVKFAVDCADALIEKLKKQAAIKDGNSIDPHFGKPIITDCGAKEKIQEKIIELSHKEVSKKREQVGWSDEDENEVAILEAYITSGEWSEAHIDRALGIVEELVNKLKSIN